MFISYFCRENLEQKYWNPGGDDMPLQENYNLS